MNSSLIMSRVKKYSPFVQEITSFKKNQHQPPPKKTKTTNNYYHVRLQVWQSIAGALKEITAFSCPLWPSAESYCPEY